MIHSFWVANFVHALFLCCCQTEVLFTGFNKITCGQTSNRGQQDFKTELWLSAAALHSLKPKKISRKKSVWQPGNHDHVFLRICTIACFTLNPKKEGQMCKSICCWIATPFSSHFLLKSSDKKGSFNCSLQMKPESLHCPSMMSSAMMVICPPCYQQWVVVERQKRLSIQCFSHKNPTVVRSETARRDLFYFAKILTKTLK